MNKIVKHFQFKTTIYRWQLQLFGICMLTVGIVVGSYLSLSRWIIPWARAVSSPWTQTDWSGGDSAVKATGTVTTWTNLDSIEATSSAGLIALKETSGWASDYANWSRRKAVTITNSGSVQTDYQVRLSVSYDANMQADFDDLRFTDSSGTALDYWLQSKTNSTSAVIWIEVSSLAGSGDTTVYMYYGNSAVSSASNGEATFMLFDNFDDGTLDTSKWTEVDQVPPGEIYESGGKLHFVRLSSDTWDKAVYGVTTYTRADISFEMDYVWANNNSSYDALMMGWHDNSSGTSYANLVYGYYNNGYGSGSSVSQMIYEDGASRGSSFSWVLNQDYDVRMRMRASGGAYYDFSTDSGATWTNRYTSSYSTESNLRPGWTFYSGTHEFDNARIRKWMSSEPSSSFGSESSRYPSSGSLTSIILDAGFAADWGAITYTASASGVTVKVRTDSDGDFSNASSWGSCTALSSGDDLATTDTTCVSDQDQYLQYQISLAVQGALSPEFYDVSVAFTASDQVVPSTNASSVSLIGISDGGWTGTEPSITFTAGADNSGGGGLAGYCVALEEASIGSSGSLDPATAAGVLTGIDDGISNPSSCPYIVSSTSFDLSSVSGLTLTDNKQYYFSLKAVDIAGNVYSGASGTYQDLVSFKYDGTNPTPPSYLSLPGDFVATKSATITWPTSGGDVAADTGGSGLSGLQYRIGSGGTWYGDNHNGNQDSTDLLTNDGSYATIQDPDFSSISEGSNLIYLRSIDVAGNVSSTTVQGALKVNTTSPSSPLSLAVSPADSTSNSYAFTWSDPSTYTGEASNLSFCYTVNTLPSVSTCSYTVADANSLSADAFATQPGTNTFYLVAKDEAGNINYDTYSSVTFSYSGESPGIPLNADIADVSVKATSSWKLALSWEAPSSVGAGVSTYQIYHSTDASSYSLESTVTGISYVDTSLTQVIHYYKIRACDSANSCGAYTSVISFLPDGKFTSAAGLSSNPTVSSVTTKQATITWSTDRTSDSKMQYGTGSGSYFDEEPSKSTQETSHSITLTSLSPGTTYYFKAKWTDEDGNTGISTEYSFTTDPAPTVKDVEESSIGLDSALISYTVTGASKVKIYYGLSTSFGGVVELTTSTNETSYTTQLIGLEDGKKYYYKINGFDTDGVEYEGTVLFFTTLPRPKISTVRLQQVRGTVSSTVLVTWTSNTEISSIVSYYPTANPGQILDEIDVKLKKAHRLIIKRLLPQTQYTLVVKGRDKAGNEASSNYQTFTTATDTRPPMISNLNTEPVIEGTGEEAVAQIVVTWDTDELSSSQVLFGEGSSGVMSSKTQLDGALTFNHMVVVPSLQSSKVYRVRAVSADKVNNTSESIDMVIITPKATQSALNLVVNNLSRAFGFLKEINQGL